MLTGLGGFSYKFGEDDLKEYRDGYPDAKDDPTLNANLRFYMNEIEAAPEKIKIDDIHKEWFGNHDWLEYCHSYIQWIFPIQEKGLNWEAQILQKHEIAEMRKHPEVIDRIVMSYRMMLDFYGMELADPKTGEVRRATTWEAQYKNLNTSGHNYLRITRILKCLGEMGLEHYKEPWLQHFEHEIYETKELVNCRRSYEDYWSGTVMDDARRMAMKEKAKELGKSLPAPRSYW